MSTAEDALLRFAADLVEEIAAGRAIELADHAELARRQKIEREAEPPAPGAPLTPVYPWNPWSHTLQNPANRTHLLGAQLQAIQHGASLSPADALAHKTVSEPAPPAPEPPKSRSRATGMRAMRQQARRSARLRQRSPGWVSDKGQHGGYGGSTGGGGTGGD